MGAGALGALLGAAAVPEQAVTRTATIAIPTFRARMPYSMPAAG
jgi:hypothetical protein